MVYPRMDSTRLGLINRGGFHLNDHDGLACYLCALLLSRVIATSEFSGLQGILLALLSTYIRSLVMTTRVY